MQLFHSILTFAAVAAALPSSTLDTKLPQLIGKDGALMKSGHCQIGQHYCFSQIVGDLSTPSLFLADQH